MHCRNCGSQTTSFNTPCQTCGFLPLNGKSFCQDCGYETKEGQEICIHCNTRLRFAAGPASTNYNNNYNQYQQQPHREFVDEPNMLANLGTFCCTPVIGLILYLVWKDEKPIAAQSVCHWTIASVVLYALFYILAFVASFATQSAMLF